MTPTLTNIITAQENTLLVRETIHSHTIPPMRQPDTKTINTFTLTNKTKETPPPTTSPCITIYEHHTQSDIYYPETPIPAITHTPPHQGITTHIGKTTAQIHMQYAIHLCQQCPIITHCRNTTLKREHENGTTQLQQIHGVAAGLTPKTRARYHDHIKNTQQNTKEVNTP